MKNNAIYIGLGVVALAAVGFFVYRRNQGSAEDMETRAAELDSEMETPRQTPSSTGVSTPKTPPTSSAPATSSAASNDVLFLAYGISQKDYDKMVAQKTKIEKEADAAQLPNATKLEVVGKSLIDFASKNNISIEGFQKAFISKNPAAAASAPSAPSRRDCSDEADAKGLKGLKRAGFMLACRAQGGAKFDGGDAFAFSYADDTYDLFS
jgi:cytoskeletal protein RodZ